MADVAATVWVGVGKFAGDVSSGADVVLAKVQPDSSNKLIVRTIILYIKSSPPKTAPNGLVQPRCGCVVATLARQKIQMRAEALNQRSGTKCPTANALSSAAL